MDSGYGQVDIMSISALSYSWMWVYDINEDLFTESFTIRFNPQSAVAQTALTNTYGGNDCGIGIGHFETRPVPNGPNQPTDFSYDPDFGYPPAVNADQMTMVTAELWVGGSQQAAGLLTVFFFD